MLGPHAHPEITMNTPSLSHYVTALEAGDLDAVADLMLQSARILGAAGADILICPDNTIHQAFQRVTAASPLPWLHIAEVTAEEATRQGLTSLAILGTASLVHSEVYPETLHRHGISAIRPAPDVIERIDRIIFDELVPGRILPRSRTEISGHIQDLRQQSCDGVILGCTELPLLIGPADSPLPLLDTTRLLARAALDRALA